MNKVRTQLMLCGGTGCRASASGLFQEALQKELERMELSDEIKIIETGCNGFCAVGAGYAGSARGYLLPEAEAQRRTRTSSKSIFLRAVR